MGGLGLGRPRPSGKAECFRLGEASQTADVAAQGPDLCGQPLTSSWEAEGIAFLKHDMKQTGGGQCSARKML